VFRELDEAETRQLMQHAGTLSVIKIRQALCGGGNLWTASIGDELVGICWATRVYAVPARTPGLSDLDVVIHDFVVAPVLHDRGVLPAIVREMAATLAGEGVERLVTERPAWDVTGRQMLLESGFSNAEASGK
jgi:hypothetical protein